MDSTIFYLGLGGVSPSERGLAWRFLFGMYPCSSTALERSLLREQLLVRYQVMKRRWQQFLPSAVRMQLNGTDGKGPNMHKLWYQWEADDFHFLLWSLLAQSISPLPHFPFSPLNTCADVTQLSCSQRFGTLTRGRHKPSSRTRISLRRWRTDWHSWSFKLRLI